MAVTLQQILNSAYPAYAATHRLPLHVHKAVSVLRRCRTGGLGRNAVRCANGHVLAVRRNSCRHRACPQCGWRKAEDWLERWQARLLPVTHFHVIFTVPQELHILWRWNRRRGHGLAHLGQCVAHPSPRARAAHCGWCRRTGQLGVHPAELPDLGPHPA